MNIFEMPLNSPLKTQYAANTRNAKGFYAFPSWGRIWRLREETLARGTHKKAGNAQSPPELAG